MSKKKALSGFSSTFWETKYFGDFGHEVHRERRSSSDVEFVTSVKYFWAQVGLNGKKQENFFCLHCFQSWILVCFKHKVFVLVLRVFILFI